MIYYLISLEIGVVLDIVVAAYVLQGWYIRFTKQDMQMFLVVIIIMVQM